jgi:hypothetical protein
MKRYISILAFFSLWAFAIYFFADIIFGYLGYMLQIQNKVLTFLQEHQIILALVLSLFVTATGAYKKWSNNKQLFSIEALLRYFLGFSLLSYGLTKIFQTQFITVSFATWQLPLERLSGIALTWAFLGRSSWFQVLLGFLEFIPAILLLFRRTALLGAILLLPMTLNVFVINHALELWSDTRTLSMQYLAVNVLILLIEWKKIRNILMIIINKGSRFKHFRWEALIILVAVIAYLYPFTKMILDYKGQKNELIGNWFNRHPNEWILQSEKINDSALDHRMLKSYFGVYNSYSEINDTGFVFKGISYDLDEKKKTLNLYYKNDSIAHFTYRILNDTLLETQMIIDSSKNVKLTRLFKRRTINGNR